jgi:hypothetical protein
MYCEGHVELRDRIRSPAAFPGSLLVERALTTARVVAAEFTPPGVPP